jgi:peptidoglycan pentaglycine glycine transferase (the first glycine)
MSMPPSHSSASAKADCSFGYGVRISRECCDPDWDAFLARCAGGHHEQTSLWGQFKSIYGWQPIRILVHKQDQICGGAQVLTRQFGRWGRIGQVSRGPVASSSDPELIDTILRELDHAMGVERLTYLAVVPSYAGATFEPALQRLGFWQKPNALPPCGAMTATLLLDLSLTLDELMARMRATTLKQIRRASRTGIIVRQGAASDVEKFRELMWDLCARRGSAPIPPQKDYFEHMWRVLRPSGHVALFVAEFEGETVASIFAATFGDTVRTWKIGWAGAHAKSYPIKLL